MRDCSLQDMVIREVKILRAVSKIDLGNHEILIGTLKISQQ